ncbi:MAG: hypothetical protein ACMUIP_10330, partial [bacterium]
MKIPDNYGTKNQEGTILIIIIMVMVVLTFLGIFIIITASTDMQSVARTKIEEVAFYSAEAGISAGRAGLNTLKNADTGSWDILLNQMQDQNIAEPRNLINLIDQSNLGSGSFILEVHDNNDLDDTDLVDTDNCIYLISTGTYNNITVTIETIVRYVGNGDQYAQEHYGTENTGYAGGVGGEAT